MRGLPACLPPCLPFLGAESWATEELLLLLLSLLFLFGQRGVCLADMSVLLLAHMQTASGSGICCTVKVEVLPLRRHPLLFLIIEMIQSTPALTSRLKWFTLSIETLLGPKEALSEDTFLYETVGWSSSTIKVSSYLSQRFLGQPKLQPLLW